MRTIKRKRIFGGKKSIHKKKHKRSLKKFRGGVELNYLQAGINIYNVRGILGSHKTLPLYKKEADYSRLGNIESPQQPNLFKGSIKHDKGTVILTDYKPLKSIKLGWIYGGHFGNIVIYSSADELSNVIEKINDLLFKNDAEIDKTLFVREINEEVIKFCENSETLKKEISPWESMTQEFDFVDEDLDNTDIDTMFKGILIKYYEEKINGISKEKIKALIESVKVDGGEMSIVRISPESLKKYKNILQRRNNSFVKEFSTDYINDNTIPTDEKWGQQIPEPNDTSLPIDHLTNYPDIYKKINALRLKQEMIYKELTDIFSINTNIHNKVIIPFNIEYFLYDVNIIPPPNSNELINRVIEKFNQETLFNDRCYKCISKIMYILQLFHQNDKIYRNDAIVRYKKISVNDHGLEPQKIDEFLNLAEPPEPLPGFRDFLNGYVINSLIDPVIMARLLSFNIQTKATILLSCTNNNTEQHTIRGQNYNTITNLDINHTSNFYKSIDDDDSRLKIKRLKINDKEITDTDLENAREPNSDQTKVTTFARELDEDFEEVKDIECDLDATEHNLNINLKCKCKIYRVDNDNTTDIMIYLFDEDKQSSFNNTLIRNLLNKAAQQEYNDTFNATITYLDHYYDHLLGDENGHENTFYDLIL